jgi:hypothetical protein
MKELQRLAAWMAYVERVAVDLRTWQEASRLPLTNERILRTAEASIGRAMVEIVTDRKE